MFYSEDQEEVWKFQVERENEIVEKRSHIRALHEALERCQHAQIPILITQTVKNDVPIHSLRGTFLKNSARWANLGRELLKSTLHKFIVPLRECVQKRI